MTFAQRRNRLTTHFSESIPVVKRHTIVNGNQCLREYDFCVQLVFILVALSISAAQRGGQYSNLQTVPIIQYNNEINYDGTYRYK